MMPTSTTEEKKAKIRDMEALGRWYAIAMSPNEAFAGVLKPDFLGFHHNSYYTSAYTPHAMHQAAFIQYLLSGTAFEFGEKCYMRLLRLYLKLKWEKLIIHLSLKSYKMIINFEFVEMKAKEYRGSGNTFLNHNKCKQHNARINYA